MKFASSIEQVARLRNGRDDNSYDILREKSTSINDAN